MVTPGDGKLVQLRDDLERGERPNQLVSSVWSWEGQARGRREGESQTAGGVGGPTSAGPPSFRLKAGTQEHVGAGLFAHLLGGVQHVLEAWRFPS